MSKHNAIAFWMINENKIGCDGLNGNGRCGSYRAPLSYNAFEHRKHKSPCFSRFSTLQSNATGGNGDCTEGH